MGRWMVFLAATAATLALCILVVRRALRSRATESSTFWGYYGRSILPVAALLVLATGMKQVGDQSAAGHSPGEAQFVARLARLALAQAALSVAIAAAAWAFERRNRAT